MVIPQAFRIVIPPLTNELVALIRTPRSSPILGTTTATIEVTKLREDASVREFNLTPIVASALVYS